MDDSPGITFGMIVLNGEPFLRYNLRALYPFAHQIVVVEGAAPAAAGLATVDGHSTDGTLDTLRYFETYEDPERKLTVVTAEDEGYANGFWPGEKNEQSQAYAKRATGDYLWQVDVDEFYEPDGMQTVLKMLQSDPSITSLSFRALDFWGGFDYLVNGWFLQHEGSTYHRLFRWGTGYRYVTHRPPTVHDERGQDLRGLRWIDDETMSKQSVLLHHYSLVFPKQVIEKCAYYGGAEWAQRGGAPRWAQESYLRLRHPYRVHNVYSHPSWLERYQGSHPPQIKCLRSDIDAGRVDALVRPTEDVDQLLRSPLYVVGRGCLKVVGHLYPVGHPVWQLISPLVRNLRGGQ